MADRILVPVDRSEQAWRALEYAFDSYPDATLVVLHVIDPRDVVLEGDVYGASRPIARAEEEAADIIGEVCDLASVYEADVETRVERGNPASVIVAVGDEPGIDHVVLGSHGRSGVTRVLLGSVAEAVVRRSSVPVTVVR